MSWTFNGNYDDHDQVKDLMVAYMTRREQLERAGKYPYNDSFKGYLGDFASDKDENSAIYQCQNLHSRYELEARLAVMIALRDVGELTEITKYSLIVHVGFYMGGTGYEEWMDARLVPGEILAVLPKGKRTRGNYLVGGKVLVMK